MRLTGSKKSTRTVAKFGTCHGELMLSHDCAHTVGTWLTRRDHQEKRKMPSVERLGSGASDPRL